MARNRWVRWAVRTERAVEHRIGEILRRRPSWQVVVVPYIAHGTTTHCQVSGRALVRRREPAQRTGVLGVFLTAVSRYASVDAPGEDVTVEVAGRTARVTSSSEGYVEATIELPHLVPGWHSVTFRLGGEIARGRLMIVDPDAELGVISDLDDTVIHTGLTRTIVAMRTTLLVADAERAAIPGGAELYQGLVAGDGGRAPVCYVSTGAWNLHRMLVEFLERTDFPLGPLILTDWGPSERWIFREDSVAFKTRAIRALFAEHPHLSWVLVGDSGQHDAETYAQVVREHPDRVRAVYIRDVPPASLLRTSRVTELADEVAALGVPMLLIPDSLAAAEHACSLGLVDTGTVERVRAAVG